MIVALAALLSMPAHADDAQVWTQAILRFPVDDGTVWVIPNFRVGDGGTDPYQLNTHVGATFQVTPGLELGPFGTVQFQKDAAGQWRREFRASVMARASWDMAAGRWSMRHWVERRFLERSSTWRWRTLLRADWAPWFVSDELFWNLEPTMALARNRLQAGWSRPLSRDQVLSVYYVFESDRARPTWVHKHALGTTITVTF